MKKFILILLPLFLFTSCFPSTNSEESSAFWYEEYKIKRILSKCKGVTEVAITTRQDVTDCRATIYVKMNDNRYLEFNHVKYGFSYKMDNVNLEFIQIGDLLPVCISYKKIRGSINNPNYHYDHLIKRNAYLSDINEFFPEIQNLTDIINNYDLIYEFMLKLSDFPKEDFHYKGYELYTKDLNLQDWNSYKSDYSYYNAIDKSYNKMFKFSVEDYNDWYIQQNPEFIKHHNYFEMQNP